MLRVRYGITPVRNVPYLDPALAPTLPFSTPVPSSEFCQRLVRPQFPGLHYSTARSKISSFGFLSDLAEELHPLPACSFPSHRPLARTLSTAKVGCSFIFFFFYFSSNGHRSWTSPQGTIGAAHCVAAPFRALRSIRYAPRRGYTFSRISL